MSHPRCSSSSAHSDCRLMIAWLRHAQLPHTRIQRAQSSPYPWFQQERSKQASSSHSVASMCLMLAGHKRHGV